LADHRDGTIEVAREGGGWPEEEIAVAVAVQGDLVTRGCDLGGERRPALDLFADEEEGGDHVGSCERLEDSGRPLRVGSVVEGEGDAGAMRQTTVDA